MDVPAIENRARIPDEAIMDVVNQITTQFRPKKIILFGSYARGTPRPDSDVDLLVIMDTLQRESRQAVEILRKINYLFGLDLLVHTPGNFATRLEMGDSFLREITRTGKVLYECSDC
jgi:predicted nucleotidyltransferase